MGQTRVLKRKSVGVLPVSAEDVRRQARRLPEWGFLRRVRLTRAIVRHHHSDAVFQLSSRLRLYFSLTYSVFSELFKSLTCVQRFVVLASWCRATTAPLSSCFARLRHSAFACTRNSWRERGSASMSQWMSAAFLGTSSGGGPSESRNCSSLVLDIVGDGSLWSTHLSPCAQVTIDRLTSDLQFIVVDGAEGTLRQFSLQPEGGKPFQVAKVNKIFITHMHRECFLPCNTESSSRSIEADHIMGLPTLLRNILGFPHPEALSSRGALVNTSPVYM
jgi:hypothetical protein